MNAINWAVLMPLALLGYIVYCLFVPPKAVRDRLLKELTEKETKTDRQYKRKVFSAIGITSVIYERAEITGFITSFKPRPLIFENIAKGDYSQTLFLNVDFNGNLQVSSTEAEAHAKYKRGDFGMSSITMSDGTVQFRDILPEGEDPKNLIKLRFSFAIDSK
jgi:hypothetical protein